MNGRARYLPEDDPALAPTGPVSEFVGEFLMVFFVVLAVLAIILKIRKEITLWRERKRYITSLPETGYALELFKSRQERWGWMVQMKRGKTIEHMNLASYKQSPYSETYHPSRESAEQEARQFLRTKGFQEDQEIKF